MKQGLKFILEQGSIWVDEKGIKRTPIEPMKFRWGSEKDAQLKELVHKKVIRVFGIRLLYNGLPLEGRYWTYFPVLFAPYVALLIKRLVQANRLFLHIYPYPIHFP